MNSTINGSISGLKSLNGLKGIKPFVEKIKETEFYPS
jgi:hypothetical protein